MPAQLYTCPKCGKDFASYQMVATNIGNLCHACARENTAYQGWNRK